MKLLCAVRYILSASILVLGLSFRPVPVHAGDLVDKKVLVLHSYNQGYAWTDRVSTGVADVFSPYKDSIRLYSEYLDTRRFPTKDAKVLLARFPTAKYAAIRFDLIIVSDNDALSFVIANRQQLFAGIPIVFCGINNFSPALLKGERQVTGVAEFIDIPYTLAVARKLHPSASEIILVVNRSLTGSANRMLFEKALESSAPGYHYRCVEDPRIDRIEQMITPLKGKALVFIMGPLADEEGHTLPGESGTERLAKSGVPIYSQWGFYLGHGIVGGMLTSGYEHGKIGAELALRILRGEPADTIQIVTEGPNHYRFDYRLLKQFGIDLLLLPPGSVVINKPVPFRCRPFPCKRAPSDYRPGRRSA